MGTDKAKKTDRGLVERTLDSKGAPVMSIPHQTRLVNRLAILLAALIFSLIWTGGRG